MSQRLIYTDESGDLGWKFTAPYNQGGSSRYLTIGSLAVSQDKKHLPKRLIRKLYTKYNWPTSEEVKWSNMKHDERLTFANKAMSLITNNPDDICYLAITVQKENVAQHIRSDSNKLYNYMTGLSLLDFMSQYESIIFLPDPRSIKVKSGNSLGDYLQTQLWFDRGCSTKLDLETCDSSCSRNIQFADMLSGLIRGHFENGQSDAWNILRSKILYKKLFFKD